MTLYRLIPVLLCLAAMADDKDAVLARMEKDAGRYGELSRRIWETPELGYQETRSAALLAGELRAAGFRVQMGVAGIPTAFTAEWGEGRPVIGIMGEYDALPGLSQDAVAERKPLQAGAPGHGCGHNLLGTASAWAAISVKQWMAEKQVRGVIRFYGTPAEEGGGGKLYMIRAGLFQDADVVLSWHPSSENSASLWSSLAIQSAKFHFKGKPAHASSSPEAGRSALDAAQLFAHAVELLREHVPEKTRIHYIMRGGSAPNIVPDSAEVFLYARHPSMQTLDGIWQRILKCAEAGALATETTHEVEFVDSSYHTLPNDALAQLVDTNLRRVGGVTYTAEETAFAEALRRTFAASGPLGSQERIQPPSEGVGSASTDAGDVSWVVPMSQLVTATYPPGTPAHSWQSTAASGMSIGRKGMTVAAKTLALSAMDLFSDPASVAAAKASFEKRRAGQTYQSRVPAGHAPPLNYRDNK